MSKNQTGQNRILCLSGGGVKGIAELVILAKIEEITGLPISKLFNIIAGTSVGGLIAALLTIPKEEGSKEPRYSAQKALEIFENAASEIFPKSWFNWGIIKHKYSQAPLEKMLKEHLGDNRLTDCLCRLLIPVADLNEGRDSIKIFDSEDKHSIHIRMKDILRATTAAPTYFEVVTNNEAIHDYDYAAGKPYALADGGLGGNRPAAMVLQVLKEGHTYHEQADILERTMICSINFGVDEKIKAQIPSANFDGVLGWLLSGLVDILMKNDEDGDATEVRLDLTGEGQNTEIVLPITKECKDLDDSSRENISRLKAIGLEWIEKNLELLEALCKRLMAAYQDNLEESEDLNSDSDLNTNSNSNAMVDDKIDDKGHESGTKNSYIAEDTIESNAASTETNKTMGATETKSITPSQEKEIAQLQKGVRWMVSDVANRAEYLKYLKALRLDDTDLVSEISRIVQEKSLPKEVQETIRWFILNAKKCPNVLAAVEYVLKAIEPVISNSDKSISGDILRDVNTCGTSAKEESILPAGQDSLPGQSELVD